MSLNAKGFNLGSCLMLQGRALAQKEGLWFADAVRDYWSVKSLMI